MRDENRLHELRQIPDEWHRRGMTSPAELEAIVHRRLGLHPAADPAAAWTADPSYADFFAAPLS